MEFKKLRFKNFLSFGNKMTELDLSSNQTILVTGENGAGKTTALEAFYFGMTGKPFRKIKKDELINSINQKELLVEIEFGHNGNEYLVKRGIKPNVFELYKDGVLVNIDASTKDYQKTLELLVGIDSNTFANTIFISSKNYTPFLKLSASDRRNFVENVLSLKVFSEMLEELKIKRGSSKEKINELVLTLENIKEKYQLAQDSNKKFSQNSEEKIKELETKNKNLSDRNEEIKIEISKTKEETKSYSEKAEAVKNILEKAIKNHNDKINELTASIQNYSNDIFEFDSHIKENLRQEEIELNNLKTKTKSDYSILEEKSNSIKTNISQLKEKKKFFDEHDVCPTCFQKIDKEHNDILCSALSRFNDDIKMEEERLKEIKSKKDLLKKTYLEDEIRIKSSSEFTREIAKKRRMKLVLSKQEEEKKLEDLKNQMSHEDQIFIWQRDLDSYNSSIDKLKTKENGLNNEIEVNNKIIENNLSEIKSLESSKSKPMIDLKQFIEKGKEKKKEKENEEYQYQNVLEMIKILSDKGIKSYIIKKYVPILNELTNKYLEIFSAKYRIAFNETFDLDIYARGYEKLSYGSFSSGEEQRLDLSLLFAFYELGKMKKSINTNVVFFDEISDKSLDSDGINGLVNIFKSLKKSGKTVYNISHRIEMQDKFDKTIEIEKKMFSQIKEV